MSERNEERSINASSLSGKNKIILPELEKEEMIVTPHRIPRPSHHASIEHEKGSALIAKKEEKHEINEETNESIDGNTSIQTYSATKNDLVSEVDEDRGISMAMENQAQIRSQRGSDGINAVETNESTQATIMQSMQTMNDGNGNQAVVQNSSSTIAQQSSSSKSTVIPQDSSSISTALSGVSSQQVSQFASSTSHTSSSMATSSSVVTSSSTSATTTSSVMSSSTSSSSTSSSLVQSSSSTSTTSHHAISNPHHHAGGNTAPSYQPTSPSFEPIIEQRKYIDAPIHIGYTADESHSSVPSNVNIKPFSQPNANINQHAQPAQESKDAYNSPDHDENRTKSSSSATAGAKPTSATIPLLMPLSQTPGWAYQSRPMDHGHVAGSRPLKKYL